MIQKSFCQCQTACDPLEVPAFCLHEGAEAEQEPCWSGSQRPRCCFQVPVLPPTCWVLPPSTAAVIHHHLSSLHIC